MYDQKNGPRITGNFLKTKLKTKLNFLKTSFFCLQYQILLVT